MPPLRNGADDSVGRDNDVMPQEYNEIHNQDNPYHTQQMQLLNNPHQKVCYEQPKEAPLSYLLPVPKLPERSVAYRYLCG